MARRFPFILLALALAASPGFPGEPREAGADHHQHHQHLGANKDVPSALPADGVRWTPDAPLREGMRRMRVAVEGLSQHELGRLDDAQVRELATDVEKAVAFMFANCELEPEPDHALHRILAQLLTAAQALQANPSDQSPRASMRAALEDYARQFDDSALLPHGNTRP